MIDTEDVVDITIKRVGIGAGHMTLHGVDAKKLILKIFKFHIKMLKIFLCSSCRVIRWLTHQLTMWIGNRYIS